MPFSANAPAYSGRPSLVSQSAISCIALLNPPPTDVNGMPQYWASFNLAPKRIQNGGWARQVTQDDFTISTTIAAVNMRLGPGGVRELHWHQQAEWAVMTYGNCRVTILDESGRPEVADVKEGDLWYFPAGLPHSLQGLEPDGAEFVLAFDNGESSEFNTLLVTDMPPTHETRSGTVRIADSTNFLAAKTIAAARVTIKPGGLREMHWHPNADEWVYVLKGAGRMTVFNTGPAAVTPRTGP
jgi:oxalate decarboxylase/phosphoglucose isomerase-like protein (cupin superfamily)